MSFLQPIINCLCEGDYPRNDEHEPNKTSSSEDDMATKIVDLIYKTEKHGNALKAELQGIIQTNGWSERLAEAIHAAIEVAVRNGRVMGPVIQGAYDRAVLESKKVKEFRRRQPNAMLNHRAGHYCIAHTVATGSVGLWYRRNHRR